MPAESFVAGNAKAFRKDGLGFYEDCERLGPIVETRMYHLRVWIVTGPTLIEEILVKNPKAFTKNRVVKLLKLVFGEGLLTSEGDLQKHRRRMLQPVFHTKHNAGYASVIRAGTERMLARFRDGEVRNVAPDLVRLCIANMTEIFFGVVDDELSAQIESLAHFCHEMAAEMTKPWFFLYAMIPPLVDVRFERRFRALEAGVMSRVELLRKRSRLAGDSTSRDDLYNRLVNGNDLDGCPMRPAAVRDEVVTMFLAGHETAAAAVCWALDLLAGHPDVRRRLVEELDGVCGDALPSFEDLARLPYLDKVLLETYRLYPPTHAIGRTVVQPCSVGGVRLAPGDEIIIPTWAIHRSARHYEDPTAFRPERWTPEAVSILPRFAYLPFSGGPRICIGQALVTMEDALIVGSIVKRFDFDLVESERARPREGLTLLRGAHGDTPLRLRARTATRHQHGPSVPCTPLSSHRLLAVADEDEDVA